MPHPLTMPLGRYFHFHQPTPTHILPLQDPIILSHWGNEPSEDQGILFLVMTDNAIFCYICGWRNGSIHVYYLVGGLFSRSSEGSGLKILLFFLWV